MNTCPNCGGNQFTETDYEWICQYCDTHHKKPEHLIWEQTEPLPDTPQEPTVKAEKPPKKKKKPLFKRTWFWVLVILGIIGANSDGTDEAQTPDVTVPSQTVLDQIQEETQAQTQSTEEDPYCYVGDIIVAGGLEITYCGAEKWEEGNSILQPEENNIYIRLLLSVENTSETDQYVSTLGFTCYADGEKQQDTYLIATDSLEGGSLSPGRKDKGYIYFAVPEDAQEIEVEYEPSIWTNEKVILKVELD